MCRESGHAANSLAVIEEVVRLSEAMQHASLLSDWGEVARLAAARHPLLMSIRADQPPQALALIRRIQQLTEAIGHEAQVARDELTAEYQAFLNQTAGARAYLSGARL